MPLPLVSKCKITISKLYLYLYQFQQKANQILKEKKRGKKWMRTENMSILSFVNEQTHF